MLGNLERECSDPCNLLFLTGGTLENFKQPWIFINVCEALWHILPRIRRSSSSGSRSRLVFQAEGPRRNVSNAHGELCAAVPLVYPGRELGFSNAQVGKGAPRGSEGPQEARHGGDSESQTRVGVEPVLCAGGIYGI